MKAYQSNRNIWYQIGGGWNLPGPSIGFLSQLAEVIRWGFNYLKRIAGCRVLWHLIPKLFMIYKNAGIMC